MCCTRFDWTSSAIGPDKLLTGILDRYLDIIRLQPGGGSCLAEIESICS
jgi:hypothetical protein